MPAHHRSIPWSWTLLAPLVAVWLTTPLGAAGVERRLTIHTQPPGALVKVDDNEIGISPVSASFIYYGTRKIQIIKPGYETMTVLQPIRPPWYQWPGLDFFSEHVIPGERRDVRVLTYPLQPKVAVPTDQLLGRAEALRGNSQATAVPPASLPVPAGRGPRLPLPPPAAVPSPASVPHPLPAIEPAPAPGGGRLPF